MSANRESPSDPRARNAVDAAAAASVPAWRRRRDDEVPGDTDHELDDASPPTGHAGPTDAAPTPPVEPPASEVQSAEGPGGDRVGSPRDDRYSALLAAGLGLLGVGGAASVAASGTDSKPPAAIDPPKPQTPASEDKPKPGSDTPTPEGPKPEAPKPEQPKPEESKPEQPKPDVPKPDAPQPDQPKPENPKPEEPRPEPPKPDEPKPEEPKPEEPKPEQPKPEQPKPEEPKPEEPKPEQPGGGDPSDPGPGAVDTTPPGILTPIPPANGWLGVKGEIRFSGLEPGAHWEYSVDGTNWRAGTGAGVRGSDLGQEGDRTVWLRQTDEAGNVGASSHVEVKVDLTPPIEAVIRFPSDPLLAGPFHTEPHIKSSDIYISANPGWFYSWDGQTWQQGAGDRIAQSLLPGQGKQSLFIRDEDQAGNVTISRRNFTIDDHAPVAPTLQLVNDTGARDDDRVTFDGTLRITNLEPEARWWMKAYFNGKEVYAGGTTDTISTGDMGIPAGATGSVVVNVQQVDAAGHQSGMTRFAFDLYAQHAVI
ncbi:hypothetical protein [Roseateles chitinivorans]|uniref:hypothetical protein n=1 Tax=Roseateles chitinivorans TaxID=2917965 RepID=UPI001303F665|nr:hypothetical protein [Roseateles chitinivorans]